ncbi:MAG: SUMF1/EgtB/PvdO family nonheme iron enzyme, partial [Anaerolineales bacterium]|nr:SUMF1/EgtB/PvdO family nonheme iron enzyme [Anaerolineales bacterium]
SLSFPNLLWAGAVTAWRHGNENVSGFRCVEGGEPVPVAAAVVTYQPAVPPSPPTATAVEVSEMVEIPAGPFLRGTDEQALQTDDERRRHQDAIPQQSVYLDRYYIDRFPVTVAQFAEFLNALGQHRWACNGWHCANLVVPYLQYEGGQYQVPEQAVTWPFPFATWYGAEAYCAWRGKRLPTEAEWEKAARGTDGQRYPWGDEWDPRAAEDKNSRRYARYPVGEKPYLASPYGVQDLVSIDPAGEWVADWYAEDYYTRADSTHNPQGPAEGEQKVRRGSDGVSLSDITSRYPASELTENIADFRCAYTPPGTH